MRKHDRKNRKTRKTRILLLAALLCLAMSAVFLTGCQVQKSAQQEVVAQKIFVDSLGREVKVPETITSYVASGPLAQIVTFALAPDEMAALASEWSAEAEKYLDTTYYHLPVLGQLYGGTKELNKEELLKVAPQVIIDVGESKEDMEDDLEVLQEQTGIPVVHIQASFDTMDEAYQLLGNLLGKEEQAKKLADYCKRTYERTQSIMEQVGEEHKVSALYCLGDLGCNVICKDSYHSQVLDLLTNNLAVAENPSSKGIGNEVDFEQIMVWNPDVIFFAPQSMYSYAAEDDLWKQLKAIQTGQYYEVPYGPYNWMGFPPSVQRYLGMIWMTKVLYPEEANYDLYEETAEYFALFYHCDLTEAQYEALVANSIGK